MGNYAACKKYTQKEKNQFILLTRSHFSLIAKNCVGLGTQTLQLATAEKPAQRGADSSSGGYRSARIAQMSQFMCFHCTGVSSTALVPEKFLCILMLFNSLVATLVVPHF